MAAIIENTKNFNKRNKKGKRFITAEFKNIAYRMVETQLKTETSVGTDTHGELAWPAGWDSHLALDVQMKPLDHEQSEPCALLGFVFHCAGLNGGRPVFVPLNGKNRTPTENPTPLELFLMMHYKKFTLNTLLEFIKDFLRVYF